MKKYILLLIIPLLFSCGDKSKQEKDKELTICDCYEFAIDYWMLSGPPDGVEAGPADSSELELKYFREKYVQYDENGEEFAPCLSSVMLPLSKELETSYDSNREAELSLMKMFLECSGAKKYIDEAGKRNCGYKFEGEEYDNCVQEYSSFFYFE